MFSHFVGVPQNRLSLPGGLARRGRVKETHTTTTVTGMFWCHVFECCSLVLVHCVLKDGVI